MCAHCDCMAGLGKVCSHVSAILFYIEATHHIKSCTELQCVWNMPATVDNIPYAKIADIDFVKPKSVLKPIKRGAHLNNDCDMMTDPADVELRNESVASSSYSRVGGVNPNLIPTTDNEASAFLIMFLNISHVFYLYFHLIVTHIYQLSQKGQHRWIFQV